VIIQRYLAREVAQTFAGVFAVLLLIFLSDRFIRYLGQAAAGSLPTEVILQLVALKLVGALGLVVPLTFYLAVLLGLGRMYRDNEVTAMAAAGVSPAQLLRAVLGLALVAAAVSMVLSLFLGPSAGAIAEGAKREAEASAEVTTLVGGRFKALAEGDRVFYAQGVSPDRARLDNVYVHIHDTARRATLSSSDGLQEVDPTTGDRFLVLVNGYRYQGEAGLADYTVTRFDRHAVRVERGQREARPFQPYTVPTLELLAADSPLLQAELQWRLSSPLSVILLGAVAALLARSAPREGRYGRLFTAVLVYFVYSNLLAVAKTLVEQGRLPTWIGVWPAHLAVVLAVVGVVLHRSARGGRLLRARRRSSPA
jgi:lipopolysaccharide export system permease protein